MADTRTFTTTPAKLAALGTMLAAHGLQLDPTQASGRQKAGGFDVGWTIAPTNDPPNLTIALTVYSHPFGEEGILWWGRF